LPGEGSLAAAYGFDAPLPVDPPALRQYKKRGRKRIKMEGSDGRASFTNFLTAFHDVLSEHYEALPFPKNIKHSDVVRAWPAHHGNHRTSGNLDHDAIAVHHCEAERFNFKAELFAG
jgi:hypothetical protein